MDTFGMRVLSEATAAWDQLQDLKREKEKEAAEAKAKVDSEAFAYWGEFLVVGEDDGPGEIMFNRLIISFTDFLRATCEVPLNPMMPRGAKTYISPEMMDVWDRLFESEDTFTALEAEYLDINTRDKLRKLEYNLNQCPHDMSIRTRGQTPTMPYLTREGFAIILGLFLMRDPDLAHTRLNSILQNPDQLILDPFTGSPFKHPIPRTSLSPTPNPKIIEYCTALDKIYVEKRAEILGTRRREAIAAGEPTESDKAARLARSGEPTGMNMGDAIMNQSAQQQTAMMLQAAQNTSMINAASAMAASQAMQARATRNAMAYQSLGNY